MKSYTDLKQSEVLAEFLSYKTADMYYWCGEDLRIGGYKAMDIDYDTPCWSLAALLSVLPKGIVLLKNSKDATYSVFSTDFENVDIKIQWYDNPIDACVDMVIKLREQKLL